MSIPQIVVLVWIALEAMSVVLITGRARKPVTPGQAVVTLIVLASLAYLVVIA